MMYKKFSPSMFFNFLKEITIYIYMKHTYIPCSTRDTTIRTWAEFKILVASARKKKIKPFYDYFCHGECFAINTN